ncbi:VWA domain-containing protein [Candidatus Micrarchaeota archaeon]|nr:VWA domain-containing protein [Candidatus Micrarchaeota archaeon]
MKTNKTPKLQNSKTKKSKGMLFVLDALFSVVLLFSLLALLGALSTESVNTQLSYSVIHFQAEDSVDVLSKLRVSDVRAEPVVRRLFDEGFLDDGDLNKTVLDVVGMLWATNNEEYTAAAGELVEGLFANSFSPSLEWSIQARSEGIQGVVFNSSALGNASIVGSSTRIASGYALGEPTKGYLARVFLSNIGGVQKSSYYYFGGFVGEGNVTQIMRGIPSDANFSSIYLELNVGENFSLLVNNANCGEYNKSVAGLSADSWVVQGSCLNNLSRGQDNNLTLAFKGENSSRKFIGGGFAKITYTTMQLSLQANDTMKYYFPGVDGFFSVYDSFYVPGNVTQVNTRVEFKSNYSTFFKIGSVNVFNVSGSELNRVIENYSFELEQAFDFQELSGKTVPIRIGAEVVTGEGGEVGEADVVLITDLSGSMTRRIDSWSSGVARNCDSPLLYDASTQRVSLAKCLDEDFVDIILNTSGNRVALVAFDSSVHSFTSLTNDSTYLKNEIDSYTTWGGTCICCAINKAYDILQSQSTSSRRKFIVVMSDGVPGNKCANDGGWKTFSSPTSSYLYGVDFASENNGYAVGYSGRIIRWNGASWANVNSPTAQILYSVAFADANNAFAVGSNGAIIKWSGANWQAVSSPVGNHLFGVAFDSADHGHAVGISGVILEWKNSQWKKVNSPTTNALNAVASLKEGELFAVGSSGTILNWNGGAWTRITSPTSNNLRAVAFYNETLGFAVGDSGRVVKWNGASWSNDASPTSNVLYAVGFLNGENAFAVGQYGRIIEWKNSSWSVAQSPTNYYLYAAGNYSSTNAFAVGQYGRIVRYTPLTCNGTSTTGTYYCGGSSSDCSTGTCSCASENAVFSSRRSFEQINATVHSVGFGPVAECLLANETLSKIASEGNGDYYSSSNATELAEIYSRIAGQIVEVTTVRQATEIKGGTNTSLSPSSYIEFVFEPNNEQPGYSEISVPFESPAFSSCEDALFIPQNYSIEEATLTSYSGDYWTDNVSIKNSNTSGQWSRVFNLGDYGWSYNVLGDPYNVKFNPAAIKAGELNYLHASTGPNPFERNSNCSNSNKLIYSARISASVPYDDAFPEVGGGNYTVFYDLNADSVPDGNNSVAIGANLPGFNPTLKTIDELNTADNAFDDALLRFLGKLNYYAKQGDTGRPGTQTNPIDVKLGAEVYSEYASSPEIPFMWGPAEIKVNVMK